MSKTNSDAEIAEAPHFSLRLSHWLARRIPTMPAKLSNKAPMVSFTFDDVPLSAATMGSQLLDMHGVKGTYYISAGLIDIPSPYWEMAGEDNIRSLYNHGHEIGSHTYSHGLLANQSTAAILKEEQLNQARISEILHGFAPENFAVPFGFGSLTGNRALKRIYRTSRSIVPGVNHGRADLMFLRANPLIDGHMCEATVERLMETTLTQNGWLIFYGHDITETPSPYGCTPSLLDSALRAAKVRGIACVTIAEGMRRASPLQ